ncbi:hypothetical protein ABT174_24670 [Streptomyces sparsogenes]|uniref:hypothetical protein n=1 Tax=Streptomyces sparsogenes TaxID=67365 RepID=UPI0033232715
MTDRRLEAPGDHTHAIPRDMPDQQVHEGPDPLDVDRSGFTYEGPDDRDDDVPDLDESGTGRRGSPQTGGTRPDHPIPDEPSG